MTFPNPNFDHQRLENQVRKVMDSHGQSTEVLDDEMRNLRSTMEGSIIIKPHEIPWMQYMIIKSVKNIETEIADLRKSIETYTVANLANAQERLMQLEKDDDYLRHNFGERFFEDTAKIDKE